MNQPIYLHHWAESKFEGMCKDFDGTRWSAYSESDIKSHEKPEFQGIEVMLASYGTGGYEGSAFVLFRKDGKLYEVNGSHCSCHGLEGQWQPEETAIESLEHRLTNGNLGQDTWTDNNFSFELTVLLQKIKEQL